MHETCSRNDNAMSTDDANERSDAPSMPSDVTANVWADAPSSSTSPDVAAASVKSVTTQFDDFDPFKPESRSTSLSDDNAPPTPSKAGPPLPNKRVEAEEKRELDSGDPDSINEKGNATGQDGPETPVKSKSAPNAAAAAGVGATSQSMTPTGSGSSLSRGFDTIASAFRRRSISTNPSPAPAASSSRPATPSTSTKPALLVLDKDEMDDMDESEKEAPPAMPTMAMSYSHSGSGAAGQTEKDQAGNTQDSQQQEPEEDTPQFDFNLFLEQMRSRPADPIAKYLRSFLKEFAKRTWGVNDQIRVINDFLDVRVPIVILFGSEK